MPNHTCHEYLKMIKKNPEKFGTTREHISKVDRDSNRLAGIVEADKLKAERKEQRIIEEMEC